MGHEISFELTDRDLTFFRKALQQSREAVKDAEDTEIIDAISDVLEEIRSSEPLPDFVGKRIPELESLISMLTDDEWQLPEGDRERLLATFVYFADPEDILPDDIPVIGYLDDVIIIELVARELQHVREAYDDFCHFREEFEKEHGENVDAVIRRDRIDRRRQQLHQRMRRRSAQQKKSSLWYSVALQAHQDRAPGKAATKGFHQNQLTLLDAPIANAHVECHRHRRGGGIAVVLHRQNDFFHRHVEAFGHRLNDANIRLMRHQPVELFFGDASLVQRFLGNLPSVLTATLKTSLPA